MKQYKLIAKTLYSLEEVLADELKQIGAENIQQQNRAVTFEGDLATCYKANIHSFTAGRVLISLAEFKALNKEKLYTAAKRINWSEWMDADSTLAVDAVVNHSRAFNNSMFAALVVKDAICDYFRDKTGRRPSVDTVDPDLRINLHIIQNNGTISLDSSGTPLNRRGYRKHSGEAPLNENLAAGIIKHSGWDGTVDFVDPMCGSGTFLMEAALMAANIAPGLMRSGFGFMKWPNFDQELFDDIIEEANAKSKEKININIVGIDNDPQQIKRVRSNLRHSGLNKYIRIIESDFMDYQPERPEGFFVTNPPYGERMDIADLKDFYQRIGDCLKAHYAGWKAFIFSGNLSASKQVGLKTSQRVKMFNGPIESRLLKYELYEGSRKIKKPE